MGLPARRDYPNRVSAFDHKREPVHHKAPSGNEYIRFFKFYGCDLHLEQRQLVGQCPFPDCRKEDHFYANPGTGQWDCKVCVRTGNVHTFIREFHVACENVTTQNNYEALASDRSGIDWWVFQHYQLVWNSLLLEWMLPGFSLERKISNLYCWKTIPDDKAPTGYSHPIYSGPTLKQIPFGLQFLGKDRKRPLWICEGHWDTMAWYNVLYSTGRMDGHDVIGAPGAGTFPKDYLHLLDGRDVRVLYDNDEAGKNGVNHLTKIIAQNNTLPAKYGVMIWPEGYPKGHDIRDLVANKAIDS